MALNHSGVTCDHKFNAIGIVAAAATDYSIFYILKTLAPQTKPDQRGPFEKVVGGGYTIETEWVSHADIDLLWLAFPPIQARVAKWHQTYGNDERIFGGYYLSFSLPRVARVPSAAHVPFVA